MTAWSLIWRSRNVKVHSPLPPEQCAERLKRATQNLWRVPSGSFVTGTPHSSEVDFIGRIGEHSFNVRLLSNDQNAFRPNLHGELKETASGGTESPVSLRLPPLLRGSVFGVSAFLVFLGIFLLFEGYKVPGIAALVFLGLVWSVVATGVALAKQEDVRLLESFTALLDGDALPG